MARHRLRVVHRYRTQKRGHMLDAATAYLSEHGIDPGKMSRVIESDCIELEGGDAEFMFMQLRQHEFDLTWLEIPEAPFDDYEEWLDRWFFNSDFVMAWVVDADDDYWQNQDQPAAFEAAGRPHAHLGKISNGLPAPLTQIVIDTSSNSGRWIYRRGYVEAIGSPMWLGKRFWDLCGGDRLALLDRKWLASARSDTAIDSVRPLDRCFISTQPTDVVLQNELRSMLFNS